MEMQVYALGSGVQQSLERVGGSVRSLPNGRYMVEIPNSMKYLSKRNPEQHGRFNPAVMAPAQIAHWWLLLNGDILSYVEYDFNPHKYLSSQVEPEMIVLETAKQRQEMGAYGKSHLKVLGF